MIMLIGSESIGNIKQLCQTWQYKSLIGNGIFVDHGDIRSMVYNYCQITYENDESQSPQFEFNIAEYVVNFKDMNETFEKKVREIRRADDTHVRIR